MPLASSRVAELLSRLESGWPPLPYPPLDELLSVWNEEVAPIVIEKRETDAIYFRTGLPKSHLRGSGCVDCMAFSGASPELPAKAKEFVQQRSAPGQLLFVFGHSKAAESAALVVKSERCITFSRLRISQAWTSGHMLADCEAAIKDHVPIQMLMPYDITVSAAGAMFYGRKTELTKLLHEDNQSFAITGPGRIGKTSLAKKLEQELLFRGDPERPAVFFVDFMECADKSPTALARKIAMAIEPGRRADRTKPDDLARFIEFQRHRLGSKVTLIFDEVDEVCLTSLFREQLAVPARNDHARFILVGRSGLLRFTKDNSHPLASRLRVMRLGEIDAESARKLLLEPINDLGLEFENFDRTFDLVSRQTGRSPHMIQFYGQRLIELAMERGEKRILMRYADELKWDHQTACFFLSPLDDLKQEPLAHVIALALLKALPNQITPVTIQDLGRMHGLSISHSQAIEIGDILIGHNVLTWADGGGFKIANEALPEYAGKMGYLTRGLEEAKRCVPSSARLKVETTSA
jgi:hypothetical protein